MGSNPETLAVLTFPLTVENIMRRPAFTGAENLNNLGNIVSSLRSRQEVCIYTTHIYKDVTRE